MSKSVHMCQSYSKLKVGLFLRHSVSISCQNKLCKVHRLKLLTAAALIFVFCCTDVCFYLLSVLTADCRIFE